MAITTNILCSLEEKVEEREVASERSFVGGLEIVPEMPSYR